MSRKSSKEQNKRADDKRKNDPARIAYMKQLQKQPHIIKSRMIYLWKKNGVIDNDFDKLYDNYLKVTNCELCDVVLEGKGRSKKCLDHDHVTGKFRNVLCNNCNWTIMRVVKKHRIPPEKRKENIEKLKKKWKEKYTCSCGSNIILSSKNRHNNSKKHLQYIKKNNKNNISSI
tara:strand:- start:1167 stop:1685 length:519 start_codon:yes stop_codon:yes gene_type:complete